MQLKTIPTEKRSFPGSKNNYSLTERRLDRGTEMGLRRGAAKKKQIRRGIEGDGKTE